MTRPFPGAPDPNRLSIREIARSCLAALEVLGHLKVEAVGGATYVVVREERDLPEVTSILDGNGLAGTPYKGNAKYLRLGRKKKSQTKSATALRHEAMRAGYERMYGGGLSLPSPRSIGTLPTSHATLDLQMEGRTVRRKT